MIGKSMVLLACLMLGSVASAQEHQFVFEGADALPEISIDGQRVMIHTQGLYVTDDAYWVTGRLEREPKRALFLRFSRDDLQTFEHIDITPSSIDAVTLDHPGGFDVDPEGRFWIPLSTSNPAGPSLICRFSNPPNQPLTSCKRDLAFQVNDHIGAICVTKDGMLAGANWDTKRVYLWLPNGELVKSIDRSELFAGAPKWQLAVQDWKRLRGSQSEITIAGGIDKSAESSRATIQLIDIVNGKIHETVRLAAQAGVSRPVTNEGLDVHDRTLFLLPEDVGRGAKVLRYKIISPE